MSIDYLSDELAKAFGNDNEQLNMFFEKMLDGFAYHKVLVDKSGKPVDYVFLEVNNAFEKMTALKREKIIGKKVTEVLIGIENDPANWISVYGRVALTGEPVKFENYAERLEKWFKVSAYSPETGYFVVLFEDITERKKAETELLQAKNDWERTFDAVPDLITIIDNRHNIVRTNKAMAKHLGLSTDQTIGKSCYKCIHGTNIPPQFCPHTKTMRDGKEHVTEVHEPRLGGDFIVTTTPLLDKQTKIIGSVHVARNITESKKQERKIKASRAIINKERNILQAAINGAKNIHIVYLDLNFDFVRVNQTYADTCGIKPEEMIGKNHFELYPDKENEAIFKKVRDTGVPAHFHDKPFVFPDQPERGVTYWDWSLQPIKKKEKVEGLVFSLVETTERKKMEQQVFSSLEESKHRQSEISALLEASRAVLHNKEFQDSAKAIFDACKDLLGATAGYIALLSDDGKENDVLFLDAGGLPCTVDASLPMPIRGLRAKVYNTGEVAFENNFPLSEWEKLMPKGHVKLDNVLFAPLMMEHKTVGVIGLANKPNGFDKRDAEMAKSFGDIASVALANSKMLEMLEENENELKLHSERLEEVVEDRTKKLRESERLAAIGATAGMVGHDIRNPLQTVTGEVFLALSELDSFPESKAKERIKESLKIIEEQTIYVNKIVSDLQDFSKPLKPNFEQVDLKKIIQGILASVNIQDISSGSIHIKNVLEKDFPQFSADSTFLQRILQNLINNAIQAMPKEGTLTINSFHKGDKVKIVVEDTGEGIPLEFRDKLFTPLVTSKSKGQGFGLAVVKRLTEAMNGTVRFESQSGKGTKFIVELPASPTATG